MLVTITEYRTIATDGDGNDLPIGGSYIQTQVRTTAGTVTLDNETRMVRIATDTAVRSDIHKAGDAAPMLHMPGTEFFSARGGATVTITVVV